MKGRKTTLLNEISTWPTLHARHEAAPLLREREQYLAYMLKRGVSRIVVRSTAAYLVRRDIVDSVTAQLL